MTAIFVLLAVAFYLLPFIIAACRSHNQTAAILLLNLLLGWTLVGWVVALVWSATNPATPQQVIITNSSIAPVAPTPNS
jgi:RsiW-degrading membrane proteinase PrsW (M82 family)